MRCRENRDGLFVVYMTAHTRNKLQQGLAHHHGHRTRPVEGADKPCGRRRRRRLLLGACTARALTWLLLALRRIDHHGIRCLHGLRLPLEDLRRQPGGAQPQLGPACGLGWALCSFGSERRGGISRWRTTLLIQPTQVVGA